VNAPTARVYKYLPVGQLTQPVMIARVGPGASGGLTKISPDLSRVMELPVSTASCCLSVIS